MELEVKVVAAYSHKEGKAYIESHLPHELAEVHEAIASVDATQTITKEAREKTKKGKMLYSPDNLNGRFKTEFKKRGWAKVKIDVRTEVTPTNGTGTLRHRGYREMDFLKNRLGVEVQFGKYAFMVYNVAAKMTIFNREGIIDCGIEIVPMKSMQKRMSTGVSFFEQFKTDLEMRGVADIDIPVLILGIAP